MEEDKKVEENMETPEIPELDELTPEEIEAQKDKKIKNLISVVILLGGLFVGSLFVDIVQLVKGGGFSQSALSKADVFASAGKTWVAYTQPIVKMQVINDDTCGDACKPDDVLVGLKQALPTLLTQKVDANSAAGKKLIADFNIKTLPAFIFSKEIEQTDLFAKAEPFLDKQGDFYAIKSAEAGFPVGKYISAPEVTATDIKIGTDDAKVKVVQFSDFANAADAQMYQAVIVPMMKDYGDKIQFVFKNYFAPGSTISNSASLAGECANAQGKFSAFASKLFASQASWNKLKDATGLFKAYAAQSGLNAVDFGKCLDSKQFQDQISATTLEGQQFGIQGTPTMFVGDQIQNGLVKYDDVKKLLDDQLAK